MANIKRSYTLQGQTINVEFPDTMLVCVFCQFPSEWLEPRPEQLGKFMRVSRGPMEIVHEDKKKRIKLYGHTMCQNEAHTERRAREIEHEVRKEMEGKKTI